MTASAVVELSAAAAILAPAAAGLQAVFRSHTSALWKETRRHPFITKTEEHEEILRIFVTSWLRDECPGTDPARTSVAFASAPFRASAVGRCCRPAVPC